MYGACDTGMTKSSTLSIAVLKTLHKWPHVAVLLQRQINIWVPRSNQVCGLRLSMHAHSGIKDYVAPRG